MWLRHKFVDYGHGYFISQSTIDPSKVILLAKSPEDNYSECGQRRYLLTQNFLSNFFRNLPTPFSTLSTRLPMLELRAAAGFSLSTTLASCSLGLYSC